jgi:hypothetical protein
VPRTDSSNSKHSGASTKVAGTPLAIGTTSYLAATAKVADSTAASYQEQQQKLQEHRKMSGQALM